MSELVHLSVQEGTATITLDSPHNRNALSAQLRGELLDALRATITDDAVRVVVLSHTGTVFCSGMDLREARGTTAEAQGANEVPQVLETIWTHPKPVVARVGGPVRAGGIGLVTAADIAVAATEATFAFSEVRIGVAPALIAVTVLPRVAAHAAHELFLTGETFDGVRAAEIGLVNTSVAADQLDAEVQRYVRMLAAGGPEALRITKELLRRTPEPTMRERFTAMLELSAQRFASAEGQEGITAFAEKRAPSWVP